MTSSGGNAASSATYFVFFLLLIVVLRIRRVISGTRISKARSIAYSIYYAAFASVFMAGSFLSGVPAYYGVADLAVGAVGLYGAHRLVNSRLIFWRASDGSVYSKGGLPIYLIYVAALVIRLSIDLVFVPSALDFTVSNSTLSSTALIAETATDALLAFGAGLLIGRNIRLYQRYLAIESGKEAIPDSPPS